MLKLKENALNFLKANIKPECLEECVKGIEANASLYGCANHWRISNYQTIHGVSIDFGLPKDCFEEVEELKLYVWYPREKFEGNPNKYWLVESDSKKHCKIYTAPYQTERLSPTADYFMYIEPLEVEDED